MKLSSGREEKPSHVAPLVAVVEAGEGAGSYLISCQPRTVHAAGCHLLQGGTILLVRA